MGAAEDPHKASRRWGRGNTHLRLVSTRTRLCRFDFLVYLSECHTYYRPARHPAGPPHSLAVRRKIAWHVGSRKDLDRDQRGHRKLLPRRPHDKLPAKTFSRRNYQDQNATGGIPQFPSCRRKVAQANPMKVQLMYDSEAGTTAPFC